MNKNKYVKLNEIGESDLSKFKFLQRLGEGRKRGSGSQTFWIMITDFRGGC